MKSKEYRLEVSISVEAQEALKRLVSHYRVTEQELIERLLISIDADLGGYAAYEKQDLIF